MFFWLILLIIYIPFQVALNPDFLLTGVDLASVRLFILIFFVCWLVFVLIKRQSQNSRPEVWFNWQSVGLIIFLLIALISILGAQNYIWGGRKLFFFISVFPLYFLVANLIDSFDKLKRIISALLIGSIGIALIGLAQFGAQFVFGPEKVYRFWSENIVLIFSGHNFGVLILTYPSWLVNIGGKTIMRAFSLFSDPHMFSMYLGLILPLLLSLIIILFQREKTFSGKFIKIGFGLVFVLYLSVLFSFVRAAYFGILISFLVLSWLFYRYLNNKIIAVLLLLLLMIFIIPISPFSDRFYASFDLEEGSNAGRIKMWQTANELSLNNFWLGVGLGNYSLALKDGLGYRSPTTSHNLYLDIFSETGVFGLLSWLFLIFGTIIRLCRQIKKADFKLRAILIGLIGSLVYFSVHSFFETGLYNPIILSILMVILGLSSVVIFLLKNHEYEPKT